MTSNLLILEIAKILAILGIVIWLIKEIGVYLLSKKKR
jgi:hypothetical protein